MLGTDGAPAREDVVFPEQHPDPGLDATRDGVLAEHEDPSLVRLFTEVWAMAAHDPAAEARLRRVLLDLLA
ncbi:hypothetical protein ACFVHW_29420 [Streptomyces sp. NPDC127110]|uniref:hypothetical protein n=1 Tax=Streptomyces sp. NPDC127110 TaxID=3345362 RepID=UPI00364371EF